MTKERKYTNKSKVWYNNNPALFVSYLSDEVAVIIVHAYPDIDHIEGSQWCFGCNLGGTESHQCEEYENIIDVLRDKNAHTNIPLLVDVAMIYDKPIDVMKHEAAISELRDEKKVIQETVKVLTSQRESLKINIDEMKIETDRIETEVINYNQAKEAFNLLVRELKDEASNLFYATKMESARDVVGGHGEKVVAIDGKKYKIYFQGYWEKSEHYDISVSGVDHFFRYTEHIDN